jgi:K+-transporting ATPase KdpF subunit
LFTPPLWPRANLEAEPPSSRPEALVDWENLLALVAAVALVGYLLYTLVHPERF